MKKEIILRATVLSAVSLMLFLNYSFAAPNQPVDEKRKCQELIKDSKDASPELYTQVLNCELNVDEDTFAAAGGLGFGDADLSRRLITGGDLTLTSLTDDGTPGGGGPGGPGGPGPSNGGCVPAPGKPCGGVLGPTP